MSEETTVDDNRIGFQQLKAAFLFLCAFGLLSLSSVTAVAGPLTPNDFYYSQFQWYAPKINLPDAWGVTTGSASLKIAVLDTGVISATPDLTGRVLPSLSSAVIFPNGQSNPVFLPAFTDAQLTAGSTTLRHGTYVASVAAMQINNGIGAAGVGNFLIQPIRITNDAGTTNPTSISNGIRLAADQGCKVINISYELGDPGQVADAADYARSKGSLVIVAGGNGNRLENTINDFASLIFVSGTNMTDERWSTSGLGSSFGNYIDLAAPALSIVAADPPLPPNGYGLVNGTSFASALTSGVAGLVWSVNPNLTPNEVENILRGSAVDLGTPGRDQFFGYGRIDAGGAVTLALATIPEPSTLAMAAGFLAAGWYWRKRVKKA